MRKYFDTAFLITSVPAVGAYVYVYQSDGVTLAQLYSDNGVTPLANPVTTDRTGFYSFYVADGTYTLQYVLAGTVLRTIAGVEIFDEAQFAAGGTNFSIAMLAWFNALPTTLPAQAGILWNNGGTIAKS